MKEFTIYDPATGYITGHYTASQSPHNEAYIEGRYEDREFIIVDGKPVAAKTWNPEITANQIAGIPPGSQVEWAGPATGKAVIDDGVLEFDLIKGQGMLVTVWAPDCPPYYLEVSP